MMNQRRWWWWENKDQKWNKKQATRFCFHWKTFIFLLKILEKKIKPIYIGLFLNLIFFSQKKRRHFLQLEIGRILIWLLFSKERERSEIRSMDDDDGKVYNQHSTTTTTTVVERNFQHWNWTFHHIMSFSIFLLVSFFASIAYCYFFFSLFSFGQCNSVCLFVRLSNKREAEKKFILTLKNKKKQKNLNWRINWMKQKDRKQKTRKEWNEICKFFPMPLMMMIEEKKRQRQEQETEIHRLVLNEWNEMKKKLFKEMVGWLVVDVMIDWNEWMNGKKERRKKKKIFIHHQQTKKQTNKRKKTSRG